MNDLQRPWAVILGGSSGMGWASARELAQRGFHVCIVHRDRRKRESEIAQNFEELRKWGGKVLSFNKDALKSEVRQAILAELKTQEAGKARIQVLLHSIAKGNLKPMVVAPGSPEVRLTGEDFALTVHAMATSLYEWAQAIVDFQLWGPNALVLGITSEGSSRAWRNYGAVSAAKASMEAIIRSMALEYAPLGIRANLIQAGITDTPSLRMIPGHETLLAHAQQRNPMGRITQPEDIAKVVYLLTTPEAAWINGAIIPVDGGEHIS